MDKLNDSCNFEFLYELRLHIKEIRELICVFPDDELLVHLLNQAIDIEKGMVQYDKTRDN